MTPAAAPTVAKQLAGKVREHLVRAGRPVTSAAVVTAVRQQPDAAELTDAAVLSLAEQVRADLTGAGPLTALLSDPHITDVLVNCGEVWVDRGGGLERVAVDMGSPEHVRRLAQRLAAAAGRRLDDGSPCVDARLADGTRFHAVLPPVAVHGPYLSLRTFPRRAMSMHDLRTAGALDEPVAALLTAIVEARLAYLVTGGTGSGKTTLLGALLSGVPAGERIVTVEDAAELRPSHPHVVSLQARTANVEGTGIVDLQTLVRHALRMRPDRIVVGECRGAEVADLLAALNTGHEGGAGTLHANAPVDVPARLEALGLLGGVPRAVLHAQVAASLQVVIHLRRAGGVRVVDEVCLLDRGSGGLVEVCPVWRRNHGAAAAARRFGEVLIGRGVAVPAVLAGVASDAGTGGRAGEVRS